MYSLLKSPSYETYTIVSKGSERYSELIRAGYIIINSGSEKQMEYLKKEFLEVMLLD